MRQIFHLSFFTIQYSFHSKTFWELLCEKCSSEFTQLISQKKIWGIHCEIQRVSTVSLWDFGGFQLSLLKRRSFRASRFEKLLCCEVAFLGCTPRGSCDIATLRRVDRSFLLLLSRRFYHPNTNDGRRV